MMIEVVRTDAGYHGRLKAANHEAVWTTEVMVTEASVLHAISLLPGITGVSQQRTTREPRPYLASVTNSYLGERRLLIEMVDERPPD